MKFCGDCYDIHENKRIFISNASWEISNIVLNRLVQFNVIRRYVKTNSSPYYS